ncbi:MAG TPA: hypothetical protein VJI75_02370 [Candidatus Nanoarchaeia archaeon]|nr:hypothetical protein [Candidatus Nanoarchaeia archaeon]
MAKRGTKSIFLQIILIISSIFIIFLISGCTGSQVRALREAELEKKMGEALEKKNITVDDAQNASENIAAQNNITLPAQSLMENKSDEYLPPIADLKDIATFGKGMKFIIGRKSPSKDIVTVLNLKSLFMKEKLETGDAIMDNEATDYKSKNYFVVGSPCNNTIAAELLKSYIAKAGSCHIFRQGEAWIRIIPTSDKNYAVYFGGDNAVDTEKAAMALGNYNYYALHGDKVKIEGSVESPIVD